ncbi:MAG: hypothetical protein JW990_01700 [Thermoleophilia bacterium]|nr:hypothetical protein [Thermoleophilia bacterium]
MKRLGATDEEADQIAREVAEASTRRTKAPVFRTDEEFAGLVTTICTALSGGASYYELFRDLPFLATGRIDRIVALASRTKPPVEPALAKGAKRAAALQKTSGAVAILLFALALGTIGLWYAIAVGVVVCVATETYLQVFMPASQRKIAATFLIPVVVFAAAIVAFVLLAHRWYEGISAHPYLMAVVAAVAVVTIAFLIPSVVLRRLVARREARWRRDLERTLLEERARPGGGGER